MKYWKVLLTKRETEANKDMVEKVQHLGQQDKKELNKEITLEESK